TSLVAPHMSAFGGKADIVFCESPLSRSLLGVKRTSPFAPHMSAFDPKRTSSPLPERSILSLRWLVPQPRGWQCDDAKSSPFSAVWRLLGRSPRWRSSPIVSAGSAGFLAPPTIRTPRHHLRRFGQGFSHLA